MNFQNLRINQLSDAATNWYQEYLAALDARDIGRYAEFLADDVSVQFNNAPSTKGKKAVTEMLGAYWQSFAGLEHDLTNIYGDDRHFVLEALNKYERHDGGDVTVRAVAFTDRNESGFVTSVRIYADATPVFENAQ